MLCDFDELGGLLEKGGHRLFYKDVFSGLECSLGYLAVQRHRRQHQHDVDIVRLHDIQVVTGDERCAVASAHVQLVLLDIAGSRHGGETLLAQLFDLDPICGADAATTDDAKTEWAFAVWRRC